MAIPDIADEYFTYDSRLASFQSVQQLSKRRASNASTKAPKSMKWPHKWLSPIELAKAGFFYYPNQVNQDNVACFLCRKSLDGWEKGDDPLVEHLKHSPDCGWAIIAMVERQDGEFSEEYPSSNRMIEARKSTFADKWPHEGKKGWKCKVKQMVDAGWRYTPTPESDDMATCTYCSLALDGWENVDKPLDEHFNRSPDCSFFTLINNHKQSPAAKRTKSKKARASKVSRLSTQSALTVASDAPSLADLPAEEGDSILTTATNATVTTQSSRKMGKAKKGAASKGRKTKAKKDEAVEVVAAPEPEDDDFEVKVDRVPKATRGRKRKSSESVDPAASVSESQPPTKRRTTRTRASTAIDESAISPDDTVQSIAVQDVPKHVSRKTGRASTARSTRKASAASLASFRAPLPNDDEIDAALEADLERPLTDDEAALAPPTKGTRSSKVTKADHAMFGTEQMEIDEAIIESELQAMEAESKTLPKAKFAKSKQTRKVSAKQQATSRKVAETEAVVEAEVQRLAEEEASQQIAAELEHSLSIHHSSPIIQPKRQRASSRQASRQLPERTTRSSVLTVDESNIQQADEFQDAVDEQNDDSGNGTDASMASQSTVVRGASTRRGSTAMKGKGGKKAAISRNIEEIVRKPGVVAAEEAPISSIEMETTKIEDSVVQEEAFYTPVPEAPNTAVEEVVPKATKSNIEPKGRGRPAKTAPAPVVPASPMEPKPFRREPVQHNFKVGREEAVAPPRSPSPPTKETTPTESPQSSDAENHPPSSKPSASARKPTTPHSATTRIPLAASTPVMSPSKRNVIAGLQSVHPWTAVDLDAVFLKSPGDENAPGLFADAIGGMIGKAKNGDLTSPEKKMSVEEWIHYNAEMAEERLRSECERMVGTFEREGGRAMGALEGVECVD